MDRHALEDQKMNAMNDRRVGLGILGLGDMLVRMGVRYDSEDAIQTIDQIMTIFRDTTYETSVELAKEKGKFPNFDEFQFSSISNPPYIFPTVNFPLPISER